MKIKTKLCVFLAILFTFCSLLVSCNKKTDNSLTKVRLFEVVPSVFYAPMYIAIENGYSLNKFSLLFNIDSRILKNYESDLHIQSPKLIKKIYVNFNTSLESWDKYYYWYYNNPKDKFLKWKNDNKYSIQDCQYIINM